MDISASIRYRALEINSAPLGTGRVLRGITLESADYSDIETVGYTEKRAGSDGTHASDVYLGSRKVELSGHVYATSPAELFDFLHVLRATFSPTSAYQESPGDRGFLPFHFSQPTLDTASFPGGVIPLYMNLRPQRPVRFAISRDRQSRNGEGPTATAWACVLIAKDPRVYVDPAKEVDISGTHTTDQIAYATNRGDYETPMNMTLLIGAGIPVTGAFVIKGLNGIDMTIKIENKANVAYRWFGDDRVLMTEDITPATLGTKPLILRMDLVTFATKQRKPLVPAAINPPSKPYQTQFTWRSSAALSTGSRLFWNEAFA